MSVMFDSEEQDLPSINCYCDGHCPFGEEYGTCVTKPGGYCFASVELDVDDDGEEYSILSYGCLPPNEMALFQCRTTLPAIRNTKSIKCCNEYDYCNKHFLPVISNENIDHPTKHFFDKMTIKVLVSSLSISLIALAIIVTVVYLIQRKREKNCRETNNASEEVETGQTMNVLNIKNIVNFSYELSADSNNTKLGLETSHSKSATEYELQGMVQRTISHQIKMEILIASGKYSEIWRAQWREEKVAAKIYFYAGEQYWLRETDIYQTVLMRHENILGFIAADIKGIGPQCQMFVITEYHPRGSLRTFLKNNTITPFELLQMTKGLSSGLSHLHQAILGCKGKAAIAHNNINSKNILIKNNKECCIGDFKNAVKFFIGQDKMDIPENTENSEICYLAPEVLEKSFNKEDFECFKRGDIYSFSLVLWELISRCYVKDLVIANKYQRPYEQELISENLGLSRNVLVELVAKRKIRPVLRQEWEENNILKTITKIIGECWSPNSSVRLTSLRIKKTLFKLNET